MPTATVTRPDIPPVSQHSPFVPGVQPPEPFTLVIFGATGDLAAWEFITPILEAWREAPPPEFPNYAAGTWGPAEADRLAEGCLGGWRHP